MAENQKKLRAERAVITRVLGSTRVEAGLTATLEEILGEILNIYGARRRDQRYPGSEQLPRVSGGGQSQRGRPRQPCAGANRPRRTRRRTCSTRRWTRCNAERSAKGYNTVLLDRTGMRIRDVDTSFLTRLAGVEKFQSIASVAFRIWTRVVRPGFPVRSGK